MQVAVGLLGLALGAALCRFSIRLMYKASTFRTDGRRWSKFEHLLNVSTFEVMRLGAYSPAGRKLIGWSQVVGFFGVASLLLAFSHLFS